MNAPEMEPTTPDDAEDAVLTETSAKSGLAPADALAMLQRGEAVEGARIIGLKLKGEFPLAVCFRGVTLVDLVIDKATFAEDVTFDHCTLDRPKFNHKVTFAKNLSMIGSTLNRANLRAFTVGGSLRCDNIRTRGRFLVEGARFRGRVRFWEAQFLGWAEFKACEFSDEADFRSVHADQGFVLGACQFRANALFRGLTCLKKWQADTCRFEAMLDLSKAKLHDFVYLEGIEQGDGQRFAFTNALAERILVRPDQLAGRIASEEARDHAQAMQEFALLKRNFEGLHRFEQEDWAFYRFKVNQRRAKTRSWARPWTKLTEFADWLLLDHGCGYGTNPMRAVRAAALIILVFAVIYAVGVNSLHIDHRPFEGLSQDDLANRVMIGVLTSVSMFTSGFSDIRGAAKGWMNLPLICESLLGTLLWGLFIVAFSRKVIR